MNFEDMQVAWKGQYPANAGTQAAPLDAKLLERIRRNQRGYSRTMVLLVFTQVIAAAITVVAIFFEAHVGPHMPAPVIHEYEIGLFAGLALLIVLALVAKRRVPGMYSIRIDRSGSLADRVHRDARRYRFGQTLAYGNQAFSGLLQMALVIVIVTHFGLHGPLRWIALGFVAASVVVMFAHRISLRSIRPNAGQSLSEVVTLSIWLTQCRARQMEQLWWQAGLGLAGVFLSLEPIWRNHGAIAWVLLLIFVPIVILSRFGARKEVRRLLQPRIDELEALRSGLSEPSQSAGPQM